MYRPRFRPVRMRQSSTWSSRYPIRCFVTTTRRFTCRLDRTARKCLPLGAAPMSASRSVTSERFTSVAPRSAHCTRLAWLGNVGLGRSRRSLQPSPPPSPRSALTTSEDQLKLEVFLDRVEQRRLRLSALEGLDQLAVDVELDGGQAEDIVISRRHWIGVGVHLDEGNPVAVGPGELFDDRRDLLAGPAPVGPEVHHHRLVGLQDHLVESGVGHLRNCAHLSLFLLYSVDVSGQ